MKSVFTSTRSVALFVRRLALLGSLGAVARAAQAHDGHGLFGSHWHATDTLGFVVIAVAVGVAVWFGKGRK